MKMRPFECFPATARDDHILRSVVSVASRARSAGFGLPASDSRALNDQTAIPDWSPDQAHRGNRCLAPLLHNVAVNRDW